MAGTLDYYDENSEEYSETTFAADVSETRGRFLSLVPEGGCILDLGCGSGRDTVFFLGAGYDVTPVDGSSGMCRVAERNTGIRVRKILFSELDYQEVFDGVWACSSLLHVPSSQLPGTLALVRRSLKDKGILYASFRLGEFEGLRGNRHYTDMIREDMEAVFADARFEAISIWTSLEEGRGILWCNGLFQKRDLRRDGASRCRHYIIGKSFPTVLLEVISNHCRSVHEAVT